MFVIGRLHLIDDNSHEDYWKKGNNIFVLGLEGH